MNAANKFKPEEYKLSNGLVPDEFPVCRCSACGRIDYRMRQGTVHGKDHCNNCGGVGTLRKILKHRVTESGETLATFEA